jgi:RNA polymerase sigma-70 factor (ECF subfamily)
MMPEPLEDWIRKSQEGDMDAFAEVVKAFHGRVRGHAALLGVAADSIDDVAQEVFIEVHRSLRRYDASRSFADWIRGVTRNVVLRHSERRARDYRIRKDLLSAYLREREESFLDEDLSSSGNESGPLAGLKACLEQLPEHLRTLILMRYSDGKTSDDIASELKRSAAGVRMALMRTRDALLRCMEARGAGEPA